MALSNQQTVNQQLFSNYGEPKRYDMIGENNTFFLQPGESIPLIFKFLSFKSEAGKVGHLYNK